jgi:hypothetical protein
MRYLLYIETFLLSSFVLASPTQCLGGEIIRRCLTTTSAKYPLAGSYSLGARSGGYITARHIITGSCIKGEPSHGQRGNYGDAAFRK